jgi:2-polyprenyl-6-methoxyphenol hydroxylase-like FAD-dependent oxidoreductase
VPAENTETGARPLPTVLIVGAGPAGLFAACELMRHGVRPRVVEQRAAPHHETRGTALQPAVLDLIDRAGLIDAFLEAGVHIRHVELLGPSQREIARVEFGGIGCNYEFQVSLPQWRTEEIMRQHLASRGLSIEYGTEVAEIADDPAGLRVTLKAEGSTEVVTVAYVLGAGGAHSITRQSLQEHLEGDTYGGQYYVADARLAMSCPPECGRVIVGPSGFGLLSPLPEGRWLIFVNRDGLDNRTELPNASELNDLLRSRVGFDLQLSDLRWVSTFKMHKRMARRLSDGRRFLLGDAGHLSSPLGGEGINSAIMDASNIAWKLALVVRGLAHPVLLDSYAAERELADLHVLNVSDEVHNTVLKLVAMCSNGGAPDLPAPDAAQVRAAVRKRCMLDVSYAGSALIGETGPFAEGPACGERFPDCHRLGGPLHHLVTFGEKPSLDALSARWGHLVSAPEPFDPFEAGFPSGGAVLVRPDGFIGFRVDKLDDVALEALDAHLSRFFLPAGTIRPGSRSPPRGLNG